MDEIKRSKLLDLSDAVETCSIAKSVTLAKLLELGYISEEHFEEVHELWDIILVPETWYQKLAKRIGLPRNFCRYIMVKIESDSEPTLAEVVPIVEPK